MYIYFDRNGTIQEVVNDESIRKGSNDYNKIYCYLEGNPDIDDIWYLQKNPDGTLTNEVSFVDKIVTKAIPYDSHRDMKYFQDFEEYQFYVFTLSSSYLLQSGLVVATIRVAENNTLWALGELTFNVQANIVNSDNDITQSQYDYLLTIISAYYSKTEIDNKLNLKADKSDTYTKTEVDGKLDLKADKSDTYTKQEVNEVALGIMNDVDNLRGQVGDLSDTTIQLENDVENLKSVQNVVEVVATYSALQSYDTTKLDVNDKVQVIADETHDGASTIYNWNGSVWQYVGAYGTNSYTKAETYNKTQIDSALALKADKSDTYTKTEVDSALALKAYKSNTYTKAEVYTKTEVDEKIDDISAYTKSEIDTMINAKADKTTVEGINTRVGALETDIADLESVQNVVDVVATKSALNSYDTSKLDANDKVQVISDETHSGASTIYNWNGSAWVYVGAFGGNSYTKAETYNKTQIDSALSDKADKSNTYTRAVIDSMILTLSTDKADKTEIDGKLEEVGQMFEIVGNEVQKKVNAEYICKGTNITQTSYSNTNPSKSTKVVLSKLGGMSYKVNDTIQHSAVTQIRSKNGSTIVNSLSIPSYIRNIEGYGWGVNDTCYNYIDFATKKFVQKVGRVDLGTLTWNYNALGEPSYFYASIANAVNSINVSCSLYESAVVLSTNTEDKIICITQNQVRIRDNELEGSIVDLNTKLNGVYLYYELATPIETDISSYISKDTLEVVEGGTLEFLNTYNQAVPNEIAYLFNAVTLNNIVDSNGNPNVIATKQELNEKSTVTANPTLSGNEETLEGAEIDGIKYKVGGGGKLYMHFITGNQGENFTLYTADSTPFTTNTVKQFLAKYGYTVPLTGSYYPANDEYFWHSLTVFGTSLTTTRIGFYNNNGVWTKYTQYNFTLSTDKVSQIF